MPVADNNRRRQIPRRFRQHLFADTKQYNVTHKIGNDAVGDVIKRGDGVAAKAITAVSVANPTQVTCAAHGFANGDIVEISGTDSTPNIHGIRTVTVLDPNTFTVPVNVTNAGTKGRVTKGVPQLRTLLKRGYAVPAT